MGAGKTTVGRKLANRLGYFFLDTDQQIEKQQGCTIEEIFRYAGEATFRDLESKKQLQAAEKSKLLEQEGIAYLAENAKKEGVVTTESGLQYEVLTKGSGASPTADDSVTVHYTGTLIDGTVFDSSVERGEPATFGVTQVIAGWTEALQLMSVGDKLRLVIPSDLAYGLRGAGPSIGPNSTLIFEVELLNIN